MFIEEKPWCHHDNLVGVKRDRTINELIRESDETNRSNGWPPRSVGEHIALMHSELSEALEEFRAGHRADEVYEGSKGKPEGVPIELADVVIRIFGFCGEYSIDLAEAIERKMAFNKTRPWRHNGKVL